MLQSGWSQFYLWFSILLVPFPRLWGPFQVHQLQLVSLSILSSTAFLVLWQGLSIYLSLCFLLFPLCGPPEQQNPLDGKFLFFLLINSRSGLLAAALGDNLADRAIYWLKFFKFINLYCFIFYKHVFHLTKDVVNN